MQIKREIGMLWSQNHDSQLAFYLRFLKVDNKYSKNETRMLVGTIFL